MNEYLTFDDVLISPNYSGLASRKLSDIRFNYKDLYLDTPIISAPMDTISGVEMCIKMAQLGGLGILHRFWSIEDNVKAYVQIHHNLFDFGRFCNVGVAVGSSEREWERVTQLYQHGARIFCVDVAHGHSKTCGDMVKNIKELNTNNFVIAGSVATGAGADYLVGCGADLIRVGIGGGSVCLTRQKTGIGVPQLGAIMECARASKKPIIADGGIRTAGDACKAIAAGASLVMLGGMLAGTDETPGQEVGDTKIFRGMASKEVNEEYYGEMPLWKTAEGVQTHVKKRGPVSSVINDIVGGLKSSLSYVGVNNIEDYQKRATFIKVSSNTVLENGAHINTL